ncbi:MFS transporter [Microbacterium sp. NPDC078428]|uniref:MFS transporter n=1 Tax=Microbacterium sp. NPDC078428 TaxID=3364190 RepID=UPI0037C82226
MSTVDTGTAESGAKKPGRVRTIVGGGIGNLVEFYDYGVYGLMATPIAMNFFPSEDPTAGLLATFTVFAASFAVRPLGGIFFGRWGDKVGRRKALAGAVILMGVSTLLIGVFPTYHSVGVLAPILLVLARLGQAFSAGGEYGGSAVFLVEHAPKKHKGFFGSIVQFSAMLGVALGSATGAIIANTVSPDMMNEWGWRVPFIVGGLLGAIGLYVRSKLEESPEYEAIPEDVKAETKPLKLAVTSYWKQTLTLVGLVVAYTITVYIVMTYMTTFLTVTVGHTLGEALTVTTIALIVYIICVPLAGALSDRIGRKTMMVAFCILMTVLAWPIFALIAAGAIWQAILGDIILVIVLSLMGGVAQTVYVELFPTEVRNTAVGLGYNVSNAIFGGTTPFVLTALVAATGSQMVPAYYLIAACIVTLIVVIGIRETAPLVVARRKAKLSAETT